MLLRFCPACGSKLVHADVPKFCGFCGERLCPVIENSTVNPAPMPSGVSQKTEIDKISRQEVPIPEAYYSVVLKSSGNKDGLTRRLSEVLLRGVLATRMAVDMVPSVLVYKNRAKDIAPIIAILEDERAHYAVIKGDFETNVPLEKTFSAIRSLNKEQMEILRDIPVALWLGESIRMVVSDIYVEEEPCMLVVTDRALYTIVRSVGTRGLEWRITPYTHLAKAIIHHDQDELLELVYKENRQESWFRFDNIADIVEVYEFLQSTLQ